MADQKIISALLLTALALSFAGYYTGEENLSDPSEWVKWVTED